MNLSKSHRCAGLALVVAALATFALGCSSDDHGPTIGAPTGPIVIVDGGGSGPTGSGGAAGARNNGGATAIGGSDVNAGGLPGGAGADFLGIGGMDPFGTAGAFGQFGNGGTPLASASGGAPF